MSLSMKTWDLRGRHALVCGASQGIGKAAALTLAKYGAQVSILARTEEKLSEVARELEKLGVKSVRKMAIDITDRKKLETESTVLLKDAGPVHILVNNSGGPPPGPLLEATDEALIEAFHRLLLSSHFLVKKFLPGMKDEGYGRIINVISTSVREPLANLGVSNTIRAATAAWSKTLAMELPPGVTINNILPGFTDTERLDAIRKNTAKSMGKSLEEVEQYWMSMIPERRIGRSEETAEAIAFLASPAASYIRGVSLPVDGGRTRTL